MANSASRWKLPLCLLSALAGHFFLIQSDRPWTLAPGLLFLAAALWFFLSLGRGKPPTGLSGPAEAGGLAVVAAVTLFFRLYRFLELPPGMLTEVACGPYLGYAVPRSQWPLYYTSGLALTHPDIPHWAWAWFHLFDPSQLSYSLFYLFLSLLALPLGYLLFRELAGPVAALLTLFIWGIMQWPLTLIRVGHPSLSTPFYILGSLFFARLAWRQKNLGWAAAGVFCAWGFQSYPLARGCLLLCALIFVFEHFSRPAPRRFPWTGACLFLAAFLAAAAPGFQSMREQQDWMTGSPGERAFVGRQVMEQKSLRPLAENLLHFVQVFNRKGSPDNFGGLPGRPLDDPTTILFGLGFALALVRWREPKYFYGLSGAVVFSLPAVLSDQPLHTTRMLGMAPFIAYLAALAVLELKQKAALSKQGRMALVVACLAALVALSQNFKSYFVDLPRSDYWWSHSDVAPTRTGQAIAGLGDGYEYYLSPVFYQKFQVLFLGHAQTSHMHPLDLPADFNYLSPPPSRGLFFALQEGRTGILAVLQKLYPGGETEKLQDPWGRPFLYFFKVPAETCAPSRFSPLPSRRYWQGTYWNTLDPKAPPSLRETEPVLNFSYRDDFPLKNTPVLRAEWRGTLCPPKAGLYRFLMATTDHSEAELEVDGKKVAAANQETALELGPRNHRVVVRFQKMGGFENVFHLAWKLPGADRYEILPPEALR